MSSWLLCHLSLVSSWFTNPHADNDVDDKHSMVSLPHASGITQHSGITLRVKSSQAFLLNVVKQIRDRKPGYEAKIEL